ncbi:hypothetical protein K502DRAFT_354013 [Neoconidiobolus thromboides FSU 785]|nr:hypothetical protein K502DRAFT_354013 [Neoconidiobolus thromboides FSU 785]
MFLLLNSSALFPLSGFSIISLFYLKINLSALLTSLLFALFALCSDALGNMLIGPLCGYLIWAMFFAFVTNKLISLVMIIILTSITEVLVIYYEEKGLVIACVWIGSYLSIHSVQLIVLSSITLAEKYSILYKVSLPVYIVTIF